jgi:hypothetical protein
VDALPVLTSTLRPLGNSGWPETERAQAAVAVTRAMASLRRNVEWNLQLEFA